MARDAAQRIQQANPNSGAARRALTLDYIDVAARIVAFREKHPEGSLQQQSLEFREVNGSTWVIYTAAAYRTPDDIRPGIGTAWEPIPGRTSFTRDSEVQNAETAAWGRAIVAAMAGDTKRGVASAEEVRRGSANTEAADLPPVDGPEMDGWYNALRDAADAAAVETIIASMTQRRAAMSADQAESAKEWVVDARGRFGGGA
jgi:hypothetical protein